MASAEKRLGTTVLKVQGQLHIAQVDKCYLVVLIDEKTPLFIEEIKKDDDGSINCYKIGALVLIENVDPGECEVDVLEEDDVMDDEQNVDSEDDADYVANSEYEDSGSDYNISPAVK
uniref:Uncharacterized protein n=1 Tax=Timema monikensis TaxID=170555 RepID=A0A7R9EK55_9NEOP|nr:unnamed protein product [Timema monikensis]